MAKQEMRDKADGHQSVQGQESNSSRAPTISFILGVLSLVILGLCSIPFAQSCSHGGMGYSFDLGPFFLLVYLGGPLTTIVGFVGLVFGTIGVTCPHKGYHLLS